MSHKKSAEYSGSKDAAYVDSMAKAVAKKLPTKPAMGTDQPESTRRLQGSKEDREVYFKELDEKMNAGAWKAAHPDDVKREISYDEFQNYEGMRRSAKNNDGDAFDGNSKETILSSSKESRDKATEAYMGLKPQGLSHQQRIKHTLKAIVPIVEPVKEHWFTKIKKYFADTSSHITWRDIVELEERKKNGK